MSDLYLDDLTIGARYVSDIYEVTEAAMLEFSRQFDPQPFHLEQAAADASVFRGLAASGWHTAAIAMRLLMTGPLKFEGGAIGLGVDELRWPTAVRPGDRVQLETEIVEKRASRSRSGQGVVRLRNVMKNQKGEIVLSYEANAMVRTRG